MPPIFLIVIYVFVAIGVFLVVDAIVGLLRVARGVDDDAVERRLSNQALLRVQPGTTRTASFVPAPGARRGATMFRSIPRFLRLLETSGTGLSIATRRRFMAIVVLCGVHPSRAAAAAALLSRSWCRRAGHRNLRSSCSIW